MYTIQQLQAADYLLKRLQDMDALFFEETLKLVIQFENDLWYGDFVSVERSSVIQHQLKSYGEVDKEYYSPSIGNEALILKKVLDAYKSRAGQIVSQPLRGIDTLPLLFQELFKIVDEANVEVSDSPFLPVLLNAESLCGSKSLPFINLSGEEIKVCSLITDPSSV